MHKRPLPVQLSGERTIRLHKFREAGNRVFFIRILIRLNICANFWTQPFPLFEYVSLPLLTYPFCVYLFAFNAPVRLRPTCVRVLALLRFVLRAKQLAFEASMRIGQPIASPHFRNVVIQICCQISKFEDNLV